MGETRKENEPANRDTVRHVQNQAVSPNQTGERYQVNGPKQSRVQQEAEEMSRRRVKENVPVKYETEQNGRRCVCDRLNHRRRGLRTPGGRTSRDRARLKQGLKKP